MCIYLAPSISPYRKVEEVLEIKSFSCWVYRAPRSGRCVAIAATTRQLVLFYYYFRGERDWEIPLRHLIVIFSLPPFLSFFFFEILSPSPIHVSIRVSLFSEISYWCGLGSSTYQEDVGNDESNIGLGDRTYSVERVTFSRLGNLFLYLLRQPLRAAAAVAPLAVADKCVPWSSAGRIRRTHIQFPLDFGWQWRRQSGGRVSSCSAIGKIIICPTVLKRVSFSSFFFSLWIFLFLNSFL